MNRNNSAKRSRRHVMLFIVIGLSLLSLAIGPRLAPHVIWKWHEGAVDNGSGFFSTDSSIRFERAVYFFQSVTGIAPENVEMGYLGLTWKPETTEDLEKWRKWYKENKYRLYWNMFSWDVSVRD